METKGPPSKNKAQQHKLAKGEQPKFDIQKGKNKKVHDAKISNKFNKNYNMRNSTNYEVNRNQPKPKPFNNTIQLGLRATFKI